MVQLKLLALSMIWCWSLWTTDHQCAVADPQTFLLDTGCSANNVNATNLPILLANINAMFCDLRSQVSDQSKHFATAQQATGDTPAYAMFQCRNYLSQDDCLACFTTASAQIRNVCSTANGARVIYDGCFLRYESQCFFGQTTAQGNGVSCGTQTACASESNAFSIAGLQVLTDLQTEIATSKVFFAATKKQVAGGAIYAIAQCAETVTESGCLDCLKVGSNNIQRCFPNTDGRAFETGCFIRYSNKTFFDDEQNTSNPKKQKREGLSCNKWVVIGGAIAVLVGISLGIYAFLRTKRHPPPPPPPPKSPRIVINQVIHSECKNERTRRIYYCECGRCVDECGGFCDVRSPTPTCAIL